MSIIPILDNTTVHCNTTGDKFYRKGFGLDKTAQIHYTFRKLFIIIICILIYQLRH